MSEVEGKFRERRSAHTTEEEAGDLVAAGPEAPAPPAPAPEPVPAEEVRGRKVPEAPLFDVVQYIVLRASQFLGEIPLDETGQQRVLPREAKEYIDLLTRLRDLLKDDLSAGAARALDGVLTDLRTRYLEIS